jgi:hypothetical protein
MKTRGKSWGRVEVFGSGDCGGRQGLTLRPEQIAKRGWCSGRPGTESALALPAQAEEYSWRVN